MSAGLPGVGLSGLFMLLSALLAPAVEAIRMAAGRRTSRDRWATIGRQWGLAAAMVAVYVVALRTAAWLLTAGGLSTGSGHGGGWTGLVVLIDLALLAFLLLGLGAAGRLFAREPHADLVADRVAGPQDRDGLVER